MEQQTTDHRPRTKNKRWIWFFVALAILGFLAIGINLAYNLGEPLTPEKLHAARALWRQHRPANYDLKILTAQAGGTVQNRYTLKIRGGQIVEFLVNGREAEPLLDREGHRNTAEERRQRENYDIDGLFDAIEELMQQDRIAGRTTFTRARFDKTDGHLQFYERQVQVPKSEGEAETRREQQIQVNYTRVETGQP
jgi:hypothetical protein